MVVDVPADRATCAPRRFTRLFKAPFAHVLTASYTSLLFCHRSLPSPPFSRDRLGYRVSWICSCEVVCLIWPPLAILPPSRPPLWFTPSIEASTCCLVDPVGGCLILRPPLPSSLSPLWTAFLAIHLAWLTCCIKNALPSGLLVVAALLDVDPWS